MGDAAKKPETTGVFVFLGYGFGARAWQRRFIEKEIPGLNEKLPYGYYHAAGGGWEIVYSEDQEEQPLIRLIRRGCARMLGCDLIHAWRNRHKLMTADLVWTHTEREHLAALLMYRLKRTKRPPKLIAQCIWLFDRWASLSPIKRWLYARLLQEADVITTQSPEDLLAAKKLFPCVRSELILSGAAAEGMEPARRRPLHHPIRLAALGNDMHRDWTTFASAFGGPETIYDVRVASSRVPLSRFSKIPNFRLVPAADERGIRELYKWADIVVVPLKYNLHVSGITVVFEAIVSGVPVICTDTGGLRAYFSDSEVCYVPLESASALRGAVARLAADEDERLRLVTNAQAKLISEQLTKQGYALRHRRLSESLLNEDRRITRTGTGDGCSVRSVSEDRPVKAFVHLAHGFGVNKWRGRYEKGLIPGINEPLPYGYHRASVDKKWTVEYSEDVEEPRLVHLIRRGLLRILGFDLIHAWRNWHQVLEADIVWAHTEREHLAILFLARLTKKEGGVAILAQCIWLFDLWPKLPRWKQRLYLSLLRRANLVTTHSPENLALARQLLPGKDCRVVRFGIGSGAPKYSARDEVHTPVNVAAIGNDMHRDWGTLLTALGSSPNFQVRIGSGTAPRRLIRRSMNASLHNAKTAQALAELYDWADVVVVPLRANAHVSGITVILEATLFGLPVICSDTGGCEPTLRKMRFALCR